MRDCSQTRRRHIHTASRALCLIFAVAFFSAAVQSRQAVAVEQSVAPKPARSQFDMQEVREFISQTLSRTPSQGSLHPWGMQSRTIRGRVVDYDGQPVVGAYVAFVEPIGFSRNCNDENFDKTDEHGRFVVEGDFMRSRLVVRRSKTQVWSVDIPRDKGAVEIVWPEPATVRISVDADLREEDASLITVTSTRYWAGLATLNAQFELDENNAVEITDQLPGEFTIAVKRSIQIGDHSESRYVEVGSFLAEPGAKLDVNCRPTGHRRISGNCPEGIKGPAILHVDRARTRYQDGCRTCDLVACEDGSFATAPLPPGNYVLRFKLPPAPKPQPPANQVIRTFRPVVAAREWRYRIVVPEADAPLTVSVEPPADEVVARIHNVLDSQGPLNVSWSHTDVQVASLLRDTDREAVQRELLRLFRSPNTPQEWQYPIRRALGGMLDSPKVLDAFLERMRTTDELGDRTAILGIFRDSKRATQEIVESVAQYRNDEDVFIRSSALNALGRLVDADQSMRPIIIPWLIEATSDPYDRIRSDMVATLGRINAEEAVSALQKSIEDPIGKVRVMAAWALWRITGERERPIKLMTVRLRASDHSGKVEAASFLGEFSELPEITIKQLLAHTHSDDKPPYRGEKLLRVQLKRASLSTLKKVAPHVLETDGGGQENAEAQKYD